MYKLTGVGFAAAAGTFLISSTVYAQADDPAAATTDEAPAASEPAAQAPKAPHKFGQRGQLTISAERLTGLDIAWTTEFDNGVETSPSSTRISFSLLGSSTGVAVLPVALARISFDGFVTDGFSLGGAILGDYTTVSNDGGTAWFSGASFRGGFALPINETLAFWPKAGLTFAYGKSDAITRPFPEPSTLDVKAFSLAVDLDLSLVFEIVEHFGLSVSSNVDIPLTTQIAVGDSDFSDSASVWNFGVTAGMLGWF